MNKLLAKKVAAIAAATKLAGGAFVFPTRDKELLTATNSSAIISRFKFAVHACTDCGHSFQAVKASGLVHHCGACGSSRTEASAELVKPNISDQNLSEVTCSSCGVHNIMSGAVVAACRELHCSACGNSMSYVPIVADAMDGMDDMMDTGDDLDDMDTIDIEDSENLFDDSDSNPLSATADADEMPGNKYTKQDDEKETANDGVSDTGIIDPNMSTDVSVEPLKLPKPPAPGPNDPDEAEDVDMNVLDGYSVENNSPELSFVYIGHSMSVADGNTIIATLTEERAGENADILQSEQFKVAVAHSIRTLGLQKALAHYGFESAKVRVPLKKEISKRVEAKTAAVRAEVAAKIEGLTADFQQSLDIAAAGFAQNFWRNKSDPVKAALISELSAVGVKSAAKLVDRIFAAHGVEQMREVLVIARDLASQPIEARNGLSQAMNLSKYLPHAVKAAEDEDTEDKDAEEDEDEEVDEEDAKVATVATVSKLSLDDTRNPANARYKTPELSRLLDGKSFSN